MNHQARHGAVEGSEMNREQFDALSVREQEKAKTRLTANQVMCDWLARTNRNGKEGRFWMYVIRDQAERYTEYSQTMDDGRRNERNPTASQIWEAACQYARDVYGINGHVMDR